MYQVQGTMVQTRPIDTLRCHTPTTILIPTSPPEQSYGVAHTQNHYQVSSTLGKGTPASRIALHGSWVAAVNPENL